MVRNNGFLATARQRRLLRSRPANRRIDARLTAKMLVDELNLTARVAPIVQPLMRAVMGLLVREERARLCHRGHGNRAVRVSLSLGVAGRPTVEAAFDDRGLLEEVHSLAGYEHPDVRLHRMALQQRFALHLVGAGVDWVTRKPVERGRLENNAKLLARLDQEISAGRVNLT